MMLPITSLYAGLLGLMFLVLSARVSGRRRATQTSLGLGGDRELECRVRAHGNFAEFVPMLLILLGLLEFSGAPGWQVHALGTALLAARLLQALGLSANRMTPRFFGSALTYTVLGVASAALLGRVLPF